jgi:LPS export ABC transporter protein LptC
MKIIQTIFIFCLLVVLGLYCRNLFLQQDKPVIDAGNSSQEYQPPLGERVKVFSISGFSDSGKKSWEMTGKSADIFSNNIDLSEINADSYGDNIKVNLTSDKGVFNRNTNDIRLTDNVRVSTDEGTTMYTSVLSWDAKEQFIYTDEDVFIERKDIDIRGTGAVAKPSLKTVQLYQAIRVNTKQPPAVITCDGPLEVDYENNVAYFKNNVKLIDKEASITADTAHAYFNPKQKDLEKVFCDGNVVIKKGEDITRSRQLTYIPGEGRVILEGRPKIVISSTGELMKKHEEKRGQKDE